MVDASRSRARHVRAHSAKLRVAYAIATWFGCGYVPRIPGTVGTLAALPIYAALSGPGSAPRLVAASLAVAAIGIWASGHVVAHRRDRDPQIIVVDEVAGVLLTLAACNDTWVSVALGVGLFRALDCLKPFPARACEALPGGWGVMLDDIAAGAWGAALVWLAHARGLA